MAQEDLYALSAIPFEATICDIVCEQRLQVFSVAQNTESTLHGAP